MNGKSISQGLIWASLVSVVLAAYGSLLNDFWLASTQWLLVAIVLGIWSVWLKVK